MRDPGPLDECILDIVAGIPAGALASYADVSRVVVTQGMPCTARRVARTLREFGGEIPWWRVVRSDGTLAGQVAMAAGERLTAEGVTVDGVRVPLSARRWQPYLDG